MLSQAPVDGVVHCGKGPTKPPHTLRAWANVPRPGKPGRRDLAVVSDEKPMSAPALFQIPVRIYWEDTDASGVVYYANYARFFERARTDWLRQYGIDQGSLAQAIGVLVVVRRMQFEFARPARLDDLCWASVEILQARKASAVLRQQLRRQHDDTLLAGAEITLACLDAGTFGPAAFPEPIKSMLAAAAIAQAVPA